MTKMPFMCSWLVTLSVHWTCSFARRRRPTSTSFRQLCNESFVAVTWTSKLPFCMCPVFSICWTQCSGILQMQSDVGYRPAGQVPAHPVKACSVHSSHTLSRCLWRNISDIFQAFRPRFRDWSFPLALGVIVQGHRPHPKVAIDAFRGRSPYNSSLPLHRSAKMHTRRLSSSTPNSMPRWNRQLETVWNSKLFILLTSLMLKNISALVLKTFASHLGFLETLLTQLAWTGETGTSKSVTMMFSTYSGEICIWYVYLFANNDKTFQLADILDVHLCDSDNCN